MLRLSSTALDRVSQGAPIINLTAWFLWQNMVLRKWPKRLLLKSKFILQNLSLTY